MSNPIRGTCFGGCGAERGRERGPAQHAGQCGVEGEGGTHTDQRLVPHSPNPHLGRLSVSG